jgi:hypothetical protein
MQIESTHVKAQQTSTSKANVSLDTTCSMVFESKGKGGSKDYLIISICSNL